MKWLTNERKQLKNISIRVYIVSILFRTFWIFESKLNVLVLQGDEQLMRTIAVMARMW